MTMNKLFGKLRKQNKGQYTILAFCIALSVLLITSFTLMYLGPTVQNFLPEGGDTRKLANLLLGVTVVGCTIFTLYAASLFFRYKSREYGTLLALGAQKKVLAKLLLHELTFITTVSLLIGLALALPLSFGLWKLFELFIVSTDEMTYTFGWSGFVFGIIFSLFLALLLLISGTRFIKKSNVMEVLRTSQKTEMVKLISPKTGRIGLALIIAGIFLGSCIPAISAEVFLYNMPSIFSLTYLLAVVGIYLFMLSLVSQTNAAKQKSKYYNNLVSISLMRFSAKSTTRNMCVIALLLFAGLIAAFWVMLYGLGSITVPSKDSKAFLMHFPAAEKQITAEEIRDIAEEHTVSLQEFSETGASNLVVSQRSRDLDDNHKYIEIDEKKSSLSLFFSATQYHQLTGHPVSVADGTYRTIVPEDFKETIWQFQDGLYEITNPDTNQSQALTFSGLEEYDSLSGASSPFSYIISDADYETMTYGLSEKYMEKLIAFNVNDLDSSYVFANELYAEYINRATSVSNYIDGYDMWTAALMEERGIDYGPEGTVDLSVSNTQLSNDWKYAPNFYIVARQTLLQSIAVYLMLNIYIFIITLSAAAIMNYVRSMSIASNNKNLFDNLKKLGANRAYSRNILRKQLLKIFQYPVLIGSGVAYLFGVTLCVTNDGRLMPNELQNLFYLLGMIFIIWITMYVVYRVAKAKAEIIAGI